MWMRVILDFLKGREGRLEGTVAAAGSAGAAPAGSAAVPFDGIIELVAALESHLTCGSGDPADPGVSGANTGGGL
jgi:hypothetical protein